MSQNEKNGSTILRDILSKLAALREEGIDLELDAQNAQARLKTHQGRFNDLSNTLRELSLPVLEDLVLKAIDANASVWGVQGLIAQASAVADDWWKVFFYQAVPGKDMPFDPQRMTPGFYWSYDPEHRLEGQRSLGAGKLIRRGDTVPTIDPTGGIRGAVMLNPITGEIQITLDRPTPFQIEQPAAPAPAAPAPAEVPAPTSADEAAPSDAVAPSTEETASATA